MAYRDDIQNRSRLSASQAKGWDSVRKKRADDAQSRPVLRKKNERISPENKSNILHESVQQGKTKLVSAEDNKQRSSKSKQKKSKKPSVKASRVVPAEAIRSREIDSSPKKISDAAHSIQTDGSHEAEQIEQVQDNADLNLSHDDGSNQEPESNNQEKDLNRKDNSQDVFPEETEASNSAQVQNDSDQKESIETDGLDVEDDTNKSQTKKKMSTIKKVLLAFLLLIICAGTILGIFSFGRWLSGDDKKNFEGVWKVHNTTTILAFTQNEIVLNADTSYAYHIDSFAKTIDYSFGNAQGKGRYWFNKDKTILVITDGKNYTATSTYFDDLAAWIGGWFGGEKIKVDPQSIVLSKENVEIPQEMLAKEQQNQPQPPPEEAKSDTSSEQQENKENSRKPWKDLEIHDVALDPGVSDE